MDLYLFDKRLCLVVPIVTKSAYFVPKICYYEEGLTLET